MQQVQAQYKYDFEDLKQRVINQGRTRDALTPYPQLQEALSNPGKHVDCPFHGGESDFRIFEDSLTSAPKSKHVAVCTCGNFSLVDLVLKCEGKTSVDMDVVKRFAEIAGTGASNEPIPTKGKVSAGGGSKYPAMALRAAVQITGASRAYLHERGLMASAECSPAEVFHLEQSNYMTRGETVYDGPCVVGRFSYPDRSLAGILRIFLTPDGYKADITDSQGKHVDPKPMLAFANGRKSPLAGAAVRMPGEGQIEHAGEGLETMLAVHEHVPETCNACGTAILLSKFEPLPESKGVLVWADKDKSKTGETKAQLLIDRLKQQGIPAVLLLPSFDIPAKGKSLDWLDVHNMTDGAEAIKRAYTEGREALAKLAEDMKQGNSQDAPESQQEAVQEPVYLPKRSLTQSTSQPYQSLGFNGENIYLMTKANRQVRAISYKSLSNKSLLLSIASNEYWESLFPKLDKNGDSAGPDWILCIDHVIQESNAVGVYDLSVIRGRGFAMDKGRLVRHLGDRLIVDGETTDLYQFDSEYTYEQTARFSVGDYPALTQAEAIAVETACTLPFWKGQADPFLFLGFCALAPFSGALRWRPHLWITAPAGTGKSQWLVPLMEILIGKKNMAAFDNVTTEAGIRQTLRHDALPVLLEEAEAETPEDRRRIQRIVQYARNCSTDNDIQTAKGTPTGMALSFSGRSMFAYVSTKDALSFSADKSRTACLEVRKLDDADRVDQHADKLTQIMQSFEGKCISERLIAYLSANWQTFQRNVTVFRLVTGRLLKSSRHGDQYGTLLAGYWTVTHQKEVAEAEALAFARAINLEAMTEDQDEQTDEQRCFDLMMALDIRVDVYKPVSLTIGEAVAALAGQDDDQLRNVATGCDVSLDSLDEGRRALLRVLRRYGIIFQAENEQLYGCSGQGIYIANSCEYLKKYMDKTPFANWSRILKRMDSAESLPKDKYLKVNGRSSKAVFVKV